MGLDAGFQEARRLRREGAEADQILDGIRIPRELSNGQGGPVDRQWGDDRVHPRAVGEAAVHHGRFLVDPAPDEGGDLANHPDQLGIAFELHVNRGQLSLPFDVNLVRTVDHDLADRVVVEERGDWAVVAAR